MDIKKEREAFEEYISNLGLVEFAEWNFKLDECEEYLHEPTNISWGIWRQKQAEINELKAKLAAFEQTTKLTYFLRDADYVVDDLCEYELDPLPGDVFEFEKWKRSIEEKIYIVPIFKNEDEYDLVEFSSEDEADKAAEENKAMIEAAQGEGHE